MSCKFMERKEKLNPWCDACDTYFVICRNPESPVFKARMTTRMCVRKKCRFYTKDEEDN